MGGAHPTLACEGGLAAVSRNPPSGRRRIKVRVGVSSCVRSVGYDANGASNPPCIDFGECVGADTRPTPCFQVVSIPISSSARLTA